MEISKISTKCKHNLAWFIQTTIETHGNQNFGKIRIKNAQFSQRIQKLILKFLASEAGKIQIL